MPTEIKPRDEFRALTMAEIEVALADPDPENPVAQEIARLVDGYASNFQALVHRLGRIPSDILHVTPHSPIEAVAMRLTQDVIRDAIGGAAAAAPGKP